LFFQKNISEGLLHFAEIVEIEMLSQIMPESVWIGKQMALKN